MVTTGHLMCAPVGHVVRSILAGVANREFAVICRITGACMKTCDEGTCMNNVTRAVIDSLKGVIGRTPWVRAGLALAVLLFMVGNYMDKVAGRDFQEHRNALATQGGGMLFIAQPMDCITTAESAEQIASELRARGVAARGLVIKDGFVSKDLTVIMEAANARFPHFAVHRRTVAAFANVTGFGTTPIALLVDSEGRIVEATTVLEGEGGTLAKRFSDRLERGT